MLLFSQLTKLLVLHYYLITYIICLPTAGVEPLEQLMADLELEKMVQDASKTAL